MSSLSNSSVDCSVIPVAARESPLSRIQVREILTLLQKYRPDADFLLHPICTTGDRDQTTSLRTLEKTDFFTKEIDELVLKSVCRLGIHSAKDLPSPLPKGLTLICLTKSIHTSDSLVLRPGETLESLPAGAVIATSSLRREQVVRQCRSDLAFIDLRGTVQQRLNKLQTGEADGIVVAEAALIRLGLTGLNRILLPGKGAEGQGQLAVLAKTGDKAMYDLFNIPGNEISR